MSIIKQLRDNAAVLLGTQGAHVPLAAIAGSLQMAAKELEAARAELHAAADTFGNAQLPHAALRAQRAADRL
jgi:hypothetical protein